MEAPAPVVDRMRPRLAAATLLCGGLLLIALFARLVHINTEFRAPLLALAERQRQASSVVPARRGMIFDARGRVAAASELRPDVFIDPLVVEDLDAAATSLGPRLNIAPSEILENVRARPDSRFVVVAKQVDAIAADAVRELRLPGVGLSERPIRKYPLKESMAHVLGWVGHDRKGLEGLELHYDAHLSGRDGRRGTITDARRRAIGRSEGDLVPPTDGGHIVLTIDSEVQRIVEEAVRDAAKGVNAESGVGLAMNPYTGDIVAMACWPTFDPGEAERTPSWIRRNRTVTDPTEPGSTFKPFVMSGALEGGFVNTSEKINCHMGKHYFGSRLVTDTKPHGFLDVRGIVAKSSNIGMGLIAERMGNPALHATVRRFKFGECSGVDFPGEDAGVVYSLPKWGKLTTQSIAMGYEVMVTPLQLARGFAAIVNDGQLVRPRLVKQLLSPAGEVVKSFDEPEVVGRAVARDVAEYLVHDPLRAVVEDGGGNKTKCRQYTVLGKTGTTKLTYRDRPLYEPGAYVGTFVGAAPASHPGLVVLVMIRRPDPKIAYYGAAVAAPAVGRIFDEALSYLGIPPDRPGVERVASGSP